MLQDPGIWPWTCPALYAHLLSGGIEALLLDPGGYRPFTYISSNLTFMLPQPRQPLPLLCLLARHRKGRHVGISGVFACSGLNCY